MSSQNGLSQAEQGFLDKIKLTITNDILLTTDYSQLIREATTDNKGQFWYECAIALSEMKEGQQLDMRENGRLHVAWGIFNELLQYNNGFPQIWAGKISVLNYIYDGYSARLNALANILGQESQKQSDMQRSKFVRDELLASLDKAIVKFPNDQWFVVEKNRFFENHEI